MIPWAGKKGDAVAETAGAVKDQPRKDPRLPRSDGEPRLPAPSAASAGGTVGNTIPPVSGGEGDGKKTNPPPERKPAVESGGDSAAIPAGRHADREATGEGAF